MARQNRRHLLFTLSCSNASRTSWAVQQQHQQQQQQHQRMQRHLLSLTIRTTTTTTTTMTARARLGESKINLRAPSMKKVLPSSDPSSDVVVEEPIFFLVAKFLTTPFGDDTRTLTMTRTLCILVLVFFFTKMLNHRRLFLKPIPFTAHPPRYRMVMDPRV